MLGTAPVITAPRINIAPTFCLENIEGWLLQCEARFELESIVESTERYDHVIVGLPTDIIKRAMSLIKVMPPPTNPYERLKSVLLKEYGKREKKQPVEVIQLSDEEEQGTKESHRAGSGDISINIRNTTIHVDNRGGRSNIGGRGGSKTTSEIHRGRGGAGKTASGISRGRGGRVDKTNSSIRRGRGGVASPRGRGGVACVASRRGRGGVDGVTNAIINNLLKDHLPDLGCDVDISAACGTSGDNNGILGGGDDSGILSGGADNDDISSSRAESKNEGGVDNGDISRGGAESENNGGHVECYLCYLVSTPSADRDLVPVALLNQHRIYHQQHGY